MLPDRFRARTHCAQEAPQVVVLNGYSRHNTGDWLLFEETIVLARAENPNARVIGIALDPDSFNGRTSADEVLGCAVRPGHLLIGAIQLIVAILTAGRLGDRASKSVRQAEAAYSVGGGFIQFRSTRELLTVTLVHGAQWIVARRCGVRLTMLPQSIGPFTGRFARIVARFLLSGINEIRVRDQASMDRIIELEPKLSDRVRLVPDLVFMKRRQSFAARDAKRDQIGVVVRNWWFPGESDPADCEERYLLQVAGAIDRFVSLGRKVELIVHSDGPAERGDDRIATERVRSKLASPIQIVSLAECESPEAASAVYARYSVLISVRMHAALLALRVGTPAIAIAYERKSTEIFGQLGAAEWAVPIGSFSAEELVRISNHPFPDESVSDAWNRQSELLAGEHWSAN